MADANAAQRPRIARIWRGRTSRDRADECLRYWREDGGLRPLAATARAVQVLRADRDDATAFVTISWWPSIEAMAAVAGDPMQTHHLATANCCSNCPTACRCSASPARPGQATPADNARPPLASPTRPARQATSHRR